MDDLFFWIVVAFVLSIVGTVAFWALMFFGVLKVAKFANRQFEAQLRAAVALGRQIDNVPEAQRAAKQAELMGVLANVGGQWRDLDALSRQRYDVKMGELAGMAGSAGLDWTPPR